MIRSAPSIQFTQKKISLQGPFGCRHAGKCEHGFQQLLGTVEPRVFTYVTDELQIGLLADNFLPCLEVSRHVRLSVGFKPGASHEKQKARIGTKHSSDGVRRNVFTPKGLIVTTQVIRFGEVRLLNLAHAAQGVEVGGQPTPVLGKQSRDKFYGRLWAGSNQILPSNFHRGSPRDDHTS